MSRKRDLAWYAKMLRPVVALQMEKRRISAFDVYVPNGRRSIVVMAERGGFVVSSVLATAREMADNSYKAVVWRRAHVLAYTLDFLVWQRGAEAKLARKGNR